MFEYHEKVNDYLGIEDKKLAYLKYLYSGDKHFGLLTTWI